MKTVYECEICEAQYSRPEEALNCENKICKPLYNVGQKVSYAGYVAIITECEVVPGIHVFLYKFTILPENNPGKPSLACGWKAEEDLRPISK